MEILCSACLVGEECRYDGKSKTNFAVLELAENHTLIPVCPEQLGGFDTPRTPAEIQGGSGFDVIDGKEKVLDKNGNDVTKMFIGGGGAVVDLALNIKADGFIGAEKSPSCGHKKNYDGSFEGILVDGIGVTCAMLVRAGIPVATQRDAEFLHFKNIKDATVLFNHEKSD